MTVPGQREVIAEFGRRVVRLREAKGGGEAPLGADEADEVIRAGSARIGCSISGAMVVPGVGG